jgi:hypothetical protein
MPVLCHSDTGLGEDSPHVADDRSQVACEGGRHVVQDCQGPCHRVHVRSLILGFPHFVGVSEGVVEPGRLP